MSRVIDYGLARGVDVDVHNTGEHHGSDHALVIFVVSRPAPGNQLLRIGLWNMQRDRDVDKVAATVDQVMSSYQLDALALTEAGDYVRELRHLQHFRSWRVLAASIKPGQANTAWVLRDSVPFELFWAPQMTRAGWVTTRGSRTPPKYLASVRLDGWLWAGVGHRAPSVRWRRGVPVGPFRRVASVIGHARREVRWARRHPGPLLLVEDWNATPATRGRWSPRWVARKAHLVVHAPRKGTHR